MANDYEPLGGATADVSSMHPANARSMSRRTFAKYGALSTSLLVGGSEPTAGAPRADGSERAKLEEGVMAPYQVVPGSRVTVVERDVGWQPQGIASHDRASVVRYDHAPSLRAILLTVAPLREDRSLALGEPREAVSEANRPLVTVGLDAGKPGGSGTR